MEETIRSIFDFIGEDRHREGLLDTPKRVVKSWDKLYSGYTQDPREILGTVFEDGACDEMVVLKNIEFYSMCEHHMLPFFGKVSIGYIPDQKSRGYQQIGASSRGVCSPTPNPREDDRPDRRHTHGGAPAQRGDGRG